MAPTVDICCSNLAAFMAPAPIASVSGAMAIAACVAPWEMDWNPDRIIAPPDFMCRAVLVKSRPRRFNAKVALFTPGTNLPMESRTLPFLSVKYSWDLEPLSASLMNRPSASLERFMPLVNSLCSSVK